MRPILVLALLLAAAALVAPSGAYFADHAASKGNSASTARFGLGLDGAATTALDGQGLRPGAPARTATVTLVNTGEVPQRLFLRVNADGPLAQALSLDLDGAGAEPAATLGRVPLGRLAPGASRTVQLALSWPAGRDDPQLYGLADRLVLRWAARSIGDRS